MISAESLPTYRQRRLRKKEQVPKKYRYTYELHDEATGRPAAHCDLVGKTMFDGLEIFDADARLWRLRPNRNIMPTRWALHDPSDKVVLQYDQKVLRKLTNPLYRVALTLLDAGGRERYRLVDPRSSIPDRIMSIHVGDWPLLQGEKPVAKMTVLDREPQKPSKGLLAKMKNFFHVSDRGFVSLGDTHLLPAPAVMALLLLFDEVSATSNGD